MRARMTRNGLIPEGDVQPAGVPASTRSAYALTALTIIAGVVMSMGSGDWQWLARAGALVVVIGIVLTSTQVLENARRLRNRRANWEKQLNRTLRREPGLTNPSMHDWAGDMRALSRARQREEETWEYERSGVYILVAGTLLWGFGDLAGLVFS